MYRRSERDQWREREKRNRKRYRERETKRDKKMERDNQADRDMGQQKKGEEKTLGVYKSTEKEARYIMVV